MKKTNRQTKAEDKTLELLQKAAPAVFGQKPGMFPLKEITPRYVSFTVPPEIFGPIRQWIDQGFTLQVITGSDNAYCQVFIMNTEAVKEYNKGRDPSKGYPKEWREKRE